MKIKVLVVDDSPVVRRLLSDVLSREPDIEVIGRAKDGREAVELTRALRPDVITLDIEMPVMDGLTALKEIRKIHPKAKVIMFSSLTEEGARETIEALSLGAFDFVTKPKGGSLSESMAKIREELLPKIRAAVPVKRAPVLPKRPTPSVPSREPRVAPSRPTLVKPGVYTVLGIGVSTGGPRALMEIIPKLPSTFPVPVLIVQHMPPLFTGQLARRLDQVSALRVKEAGNGEPVQKGVVYIAPGDFHMEVRASGKAKNIFLHKGPPENGCRPAVDPLFRSLAEVYNGTTVALVLTGMGHDGREGARKIKEKGGLVIAQDEKTSTVYGMPRAVVEAGLADMVLSLHEIPFKLQEIFMRKGTR